MNRVLAVFVGVLFGIGTVVWLAPPARTANVVYKIGMQPYSSPTSVTCVMFGGQRDKLPRTADGDTMQAPSWNPDFTRSYLLNTKTQKNYSTNQLNAVGMTCTATGTNVPISVKVTLNGAGAPQTLDNLVWAIGQ